MSSDEILEILIKFDEFLKLAGMGSDIGRNILFGIATIFLWIVEHLENVMTDMLTFLGFYNDSSLKGDDGLLQTLISYKSFGVGIAILAIGLVLMFGKSSQTRDIPMNVLMLLLMSLMLPTIMSDGISLVNATQTDLKTTQGSIGFASVQKNITDVYVLADGNWETTTPETKNYLTDMKGLDVNERILDPDDIENGEVLKYKLQNKKNEEGKEAVELDEGNGGVLGWLVKSMFAPKYYRWKVEWVPLLITLGVLAFSLVISMIRVGRLGIELAFNELWANIIVFFSFRDTKRAKMVFMEIIGGFVMVISIFTMYYVFIYYTSFVFASATSTWAQIFAVIGGAWFIYDGPAIIQKTLGIDAGLSTAGSFVMGMGAKKAADQIGGGLKKTAEVATSGTVATAGLLAGLASGNFDHKNDEDANLNNLNEETNDEKNTEDSQETPQEETTDKKPNDSSNSSAEMDEENPNDVENNEDTPEGSGQNSSHPSDKNEEDSNNPQNANEEDSSDDFNNEQSPLKNTENSSDADNPKESEGQGTSPGNSVTHGNENEGNGGRNSEASNENEQPTGVDTSDSTNETQKDAKSDNHSTSSASKNEPLENPFKKKISDMVHTNKHQKNQKNPIGNQVDRYKRNKEFGQEINDWLSQRKEQKTAGNSEDKRQKNKKG
ncbi:hypothetical protein D929_00178 [Enterococcus faecalis 02-MB-P-10]|uniref:pLS20_p028 family conjugation system transmembrane protein n=1 Tax=Enterococcus faecalis TaxID=1351 RepID=UPI0003549230|nr:Yip1 family protein [Enterococcus faecalis]EPH77109.1 hypothetical protein D929_00178 [Enterococcus faecalis 02-MB-P-10]